MNLAVLLKKDLVRKIEPCPEETKELLEKANEDIETAQYNFNGKKYGWAVAIAYNAMLSAGVGLMEYKGYRAVSENHHLAVVNFCGAVLPQDAHGLVSLFNKFRKRRHDVIYGEAGSVGEAEARRAIEKAKELVGLIEKRIGGN